MDSFILCVELKVNLGVPLPNFFLSGLFSEILELKPFVKVFP